ncbi:MAG: class I tRNA ligase family protein [Thermoplasmatota archaeon]
MTDKALEKWNVELESRISGEVAGRVPPFVGDGAKPVWSIDTPPPYPSGRWHIGAVAGYSLIDMIARSKRMSGHDVLFPWGTDRNGINIEFTVEKKHKKPMRFWDRAEFNEECRKEISVYSDDMKRIGRRIGLSCDFDNGYETDSPDYRAFSQAQFLKLFEQGLIIEELRPNTFDPKLGTTIADAEVFYDERKTRLNHVTWTVKETGEEITISTTRPELIAACRMVLVHPDNEDTKHLIGKTAVLPIDRSMGPAPGFGKRQLKDDPHTLDTPTGLGNEVEIRAHPHVKTDFGSGIMMVCSYGDQADVQLFRELELDAIAAIGMDGRMTEVAGAYAGLLVEDARRRIIEDLEAAGKLPEFDTIQQKFPISERSKAAVEVISLKEWYVKQTHVTEELKAIAKDMDFVPAKHRQLLLDWIDTVSIDWPISRRRYYHTEIPLWFVVDEEGEETDYVIVPPASDLEAVYYRPWLEDPPVNSRVLHRETREVQGELNNFMQAHDGWTWKGEEKVFDTWMDSSVSHLFVLNHLQDKEWWNDHTCSLRINGRDIVRTWLYYASLKNQLLKGSKPFENVVIHGMGMDKHGRKMSKSVGNVINPDEVIDKFGSDAFRLWIAGECTIGDDFRIDEQKIQGTGKFLQKLANVVNFVSRFDQPEHPGELHAVDTWILGELDQLTKEALEGYDKLDFFGPANKLRSFVWNLFAPHYLEMVKTRAYGNADEGVDPDPAACWTLHEVVRRVLLLLAPISPFVSHYYADKVYDIDVHHSGFPQVLGIDVDESLTEAVLEFNAAVWKAKQDAGLSLAAPIDGIEIPEQLAGMTDVLTAMHKLGQTVEA